MGKAVISYITNKALNHTDCVIAPTEKILMLLKEYGVKKKIKIIPTGIDFEKFGIENNTQQLENLKEELRLINDDKVLLYVGRLGKEKKSR